MTGRGFQQAYKHQAISGRAYKFHINQFRMSRYYLKTIEILIEMHNIFFNKFSAECNYSPFYNDVSCFQFKLYSSNL